MVARFLSFWETVFSRSCTRMASAPRERLANWHLKLPGKGLDGLSALHHDLSITPRHLKAGFALHYGEVSYGNIGAGDRLDFTVIGPDVNLTSRIERLCRELDRNLIMSEDFVRYLDSPVFEIGHFRLRGFSRMQLLFGLPA